MDMTIRALTASDKPLAEDFFAHLNDEGRCFYNHDRGNERSLYRQLEEPRPYRVDFGGFDQTADGCPLMVAHIFLWNLDTKLPWLGICIRDGYTGRHLGRTLLEYLENHCKSRNCGGLCLTTHPANIHAQMLYRNFGFHYYGIAGDGEHLYIKPFSNL